MLQIRMEIRNYRFFCTPEGSWKFAITGAMFTNVILYKNSGNPTLQTNTINHARCQLTNDIEFALQRSPLIPFRTEANGPPIDAFLGRLGTQLNSTSPLGFDGIVGTQEHENIHREKSETALILKFYNAEMCSSQYLNWLQLLDARRNTIGSCDIVRDLCLSLPYIPLREKKP